MLLIDSLGPGGAERSLVELLPWLRDAGMDVSVIVQRHVIEGYEAEARAMGTRVVVLESRNAIGRVRELRRLLHAERPDLLHTTLISSDLIGRTAAARTATPVLTSLVNVTYDPVRTQDPAVNQRKLSAVRQLDSWTARHLTDHFHAITHAVADAAVAALHIDPDRITVIERGRDPNRLGTRTQQRRASVRVALGIPAEAEVVMAVGRHEWQKGHRVLLDAFARISSERPALWLLFAGRTGNATYDLREQVDALRIAHRTKFLGHRSDVPDVLSAADVFAFPSLYEGLGGAVIEAMALGLPIVATKIPAVEEVCGDDVALLVPPGDDLALSAAIERVLDEPQLAHRLSTRAKVEFTRRFTIESSAERMIALYRQVASAAAPT